MHLKTPVKACELSRTIPNTFNFFRTCFDTRARSESPEGVEYAGTSAVNFCNFSSRKVVAAVVWGARRGGEQSNNQIRHCYMRK